jgi:gas vesicle protein
MKGIDRYTAFYMNNFLRGMLLGIGIGLLVAPMRDEETRRMLKGRAGELRGYLPESEQIDTYRHRVTERVSHTADNLKGYAQQAASTVKHTASTLRGKTKEAAYEVKEAGEDVHDMTKR